MKVVVTGGAGYIGTELVRQLAALDEVSSVVIYDNLSRSNYNLFLDFPLEHNEKLHFIPGDILDTRKLRSTFKGAEMVYHLAANVTTPFANTDPHFFEQVNHWGTAEVAHAAQDAGISHLAYLSSTSVYGSTSTIITEDSPTTPRTFYGASKLRGEEHLEPLMELMRVNIIRCGNVYGYSHSMRFDAVINKFVFEANFYNRIAIQGDGRQTRAFAHINSVSNILSQLVTSEVPSAVYNLVEENYEILDVVDALKQIKPEMEFLFVDQHLALRTMKVDTDGLLRNYVAFPVHDPLTVQLRTFMDHFSF